MHFVAKHEKIEKKYFREKISQCRKKTERGILWDFPTSILSRNIRKNAGGPFGEKNVSQCRKKLKEGGLFGLARYGLLRGKTGKTILIQFARPNGAF